MNVRLGGAIKTDSFYETTPTVTRTCGIPGCGDTTREGKDFCTEHVESQPYVQYILKKLAERDEEDERVRMEGVSAVNIEGITVEEITLHLKQNGTRTIERLAREIPLDKSVIRSYVIAMQEKSLVKFSWTERNCMSVTLIDQNPDDLIEE